MTYRFIQNHAQRQRKVFSFDIVLIFQYQSSMIFFKHLNLSVLKYKNLPDAHIDIL
jgi:hypothetical protein